MTPREFPNRNRIPDRDKLSLPSILTWGPFGAERFTPVPLLSMATVMMDPALDNPPQDSCTARQVG
ncbi:hypothetical protein AJ80_09769 [Polytolypa hystricis UAMH7299]|uniref:Uncharacterized protein n=1 Tax=Polytolypa hystricis (strain UAMH7299) TaxID=1447883 RepID=A0A2B7WK14_POLH7|nr:hypothetical protein AJ80_09769 [Polytolypa hystricis UAMH7299]